jgi:transcriptional regulator with XRE-family HTH domain
MAKLGQVIKEYRRSSNLTQEELGQKVGISKAAISQIELSSVKPSKANYDKLKKVLKFEEPYTKYVQINEEDIHIVNKGKTTSNEPKEGYLPYYDMVVTAGPTGVYADEKVDKPLFYMDIPLFRDCTLYHRVSGDSMYSKYRNGDIVACKKILNKDLILWGEDYLIITKGEDYRTVKTLQPTDDEGYVSLVSHNERYKPVKLHGEQIHELYLVRGSVSNQ